MARIMKTPMTQCTSCTEQTGVIVRRTELRKVVSDSRQRVRRLLKTQRATQNRHRTVTHLHHKELDC